jgi:predicted anti-sigma-YlaC factor YlaD
MAHAPFESWILNDEQLSCNQVEELNEHLKNCSECACLYDNWKSVNIALKKSPTESPRPGFAARWQAGLEERRLRLQHEQIKRFFFIIGGANILSILIFIGFLLANNTWFNLLINALQQITTIIIWFTQTQQYVISLLQILPPFFSLTLWVLFTTSLSVITLIWAATLWRIVFRGVQTK